MIKFLSILVLALASGFVNANTFNDSECLAHVIRHEARGEPVQGQLAVATVVINRLEAGYASTICDVIFQRNQFTNISKKIRVEPHFLQLAEKALEGNVLENFPYLNFKHRSLGKGYRIGNHVFH